MNNAANESVKVTTASGEVEKKDAVESAKPSETDVAAESKTPTITIQQAEVDPDLPLDITNSPTTNNTEAKTNAVEDIQPNAYQRTPKFAILLRWNLEYFKTSVGLLRLVFMGCCILSLVCLANAGTDDIDVLELKAFSRIRFHIFTCILVLLVSTLIYLLEITSLRKSMPINWYLADIFSSFILGTLCIVSSTLLLHAGRVVFDDDDDNDDGDSDDDDDGVKKIIRNVDELMPAWSKALLALAAVFGYFATLVSVFLIVFKCFNRNGSTSKRPSQVQEEIMMSGTS